MFFVIVHYSFIYYVKNNYIIINILEILDIFIIRIFV